MAFSLTAALSLVRLMMPTDPCGGGAVGRLPEPSPGHVSET